MAALEQKNTRITAQLVSAYFRKNPTPAPLVPQIMESICGALNELTNPGKVMKSSGFPAVPIAKSIQTEYLICLEDGKRFRSLKRHLQSAYNLTPDEYRAKWGLAPTYPMVAPAYTARRSALARSQESDGRKAAS